jgi:hypothetical protein
MSLCISICVPDGIILAADSRTTYRNQLGASRIATESSTKIYKLGPHAAVTLAGLAFFPFDTFQKGVGRSIEEFRAKHDLGQMTIQAIAEALSAHLVEEYRQSLLSLMPLIMKQFEDKGNTEVKATVNGPAIDIVFKDTSGKKQAERPVNLDDITALVAGHDGDASAVWRIQASVGTVDQLRGLKNNIYGGDWIGQLDVVARIILGFDPRLKLLPTIASLNGVVLTQELLQLEYAISWSTMTLQDAADLATLFIETTKAVQRFSDGIIGQMGDIPGVGGAVDIALLLPKQGFIWAEKKKLRVGSSDIDLDGIAEKLEVLAG